MANSNACSTSLKACAPLLVHLTPLSEQVAGVHTHKWSTEAALPSRAACIDERIGVWIGIWRRDRGMLILTTLGALQAVSLPRSRGTIGNVLPLARVTERVPRSARSSGVAVGYCSYEARIGKARYRARRKLRKRFDPPGAGVGVLRREKLCSTSVREKLCSTSVATAVVDAIR